LPKLYVGAAPISPAEEPLFTGAYEGMRWPTNVTKLVLSSHPHLRKEDGIRSSGDSFFRGFVEA